MCTTDSACLAAELQCETTALGNDWSAKAVPFPAVVNQAFLYCRRSIDPTSRRSIDPTSRHSMNVSQGSLELQRPGGSKKLVGGEAEVIYLLLLPTSAGTHRMKACLVTFGPAAGLLLHDTAACSCTVALHGASLNTFWVLASLCKRKGNRIVACQTNCRVNASIEHNFSVFIVLQGLQSYAEDGSQPSTNGTVPNGAAAPGYPQTGQHLTIDCSVWKAEVPCMLQPALTSHEGGYPACCDFWQLGKPSRSFVAMPARWVAVVAHVLVSACFQPALALCVCLPTGFRLLGNKRVPCALSLTAHA